jgi:hypothetical protein
MKFIENQSVINKLHIFNEVKTVYAITCHSISETHFPQISMFVEIRDSTYVEKVTDSGLDVSTGFSF